MLDNMWVDVVLQETYLKQSQDDGQNREVWRRTMREAVAQFKLLG